VALSTNRAERNEDKSLPTLVTELRDLVVGYLKQETVEPLKGLRNFVAIGVAGAFVLIMGLLILAVTLLRVLQVETDAHFTGNLSWVPYAITLGAVLVVAALAFLAGVKGRGAR